MNIKCLIITVVVAMMTSCSAVLYNKVYSYDDEFRGSSRKYLRLALSPEDRRSEIGDAHIVFESTSGDQDSPMVAYFVIPRSASSFRADGIGFIGAGADKFELALIDPVSEVKMKTGEYLSTVTSVDSSGTETKVTAETDTRQWIEEKFMLRFTEEHRASILPAGEVVFRFYFGPVPATYILSSRKLELVKEVLSIQLSPAQKSSTMYSRKDLLPRHSDHKVDQ